MLRKKHFAFQSFVYKVYEQTYLMHIADNKTMRFYRLLFLSNF